jgi:peptidoglycan hydrolase CwlO-like protein
MTNELQSTNGIMKILMFLTIALLSSGCASRVDRTSTSTSDQLKQKREEIQVLQNEIDQLVRNLGKIQQDLERMPEQSSRSQSYSKRIEARDLDYAITVLHEARNKLSAQQFRICNQYHLNRDLY